MTTALALMAANPEGKVTSTGPLTLNGKAVPASALASLPVVAGDEIATSNSPATVYFADKSRATIAPNSRVKLQAQRAGVALVVLAGSVDLRRAEGSRVSVVDPKRLAVQDATAVKKPTPPPPHPPPPPRPPPPPPPPPPRSPHCPPHDPDCR
jgi:hypothetical protein